MFVCWQISRRTRVTVGFWRISHDEVEEKWRSTGLVYLWITSVRGSRRRCHSGLARFDWRSTTSHTSRPHVLKQCHIGYKYCCLPSCMFLHIHAVFAWYRTLFSWNGAWILRVILSIQHVFYFNWRLMALNIICTTLLTSGLLHTK